MRRLTKLGTDGNETIIVENPITGVTAEMKRTDFLGILRPEKAANINFDALKAEYQAQK